MTLACVNFPQNYPEQRLLDLAEDSDLAPSIHMATNKHLLLQFQGIRFHIMSSVGTAHTRRAHTHVGQTPTHVRPTDKSF